MIIKMQQNTVFFITAALSQEFSRKCAVDSNKNMAICTVICSFYSPVVSKSIFLYYVSFHNIQGITKIFERNRLPLLSTIMTVLNCLHIIIFHLQRILYHL